MPAYPHASASADEEEEAKLYFTGRNLPLKKATQMHMHSHAGRSPSFNLQHYMLIQHTSKVLRKKTDKEDTISITIVVSAFVLKAAIYKYY